MAQTINEYVRGEAEPGGAIWCPFHEDDNHPSAVCMPDTGRFWCYACQWGGDQLAVVRRLWFGDVEGTMGWQLAREMIAHERWGEQERRIPEPVSFEGVPELLTEWARLCCANFKRQPQLVRDLATRRGLRDPISLGIGLAGEHVFRDFMRRKWPEELLVRTGICSDDQSKSLVDRYRLRNRLILPEVRDRQVVYYQARAQDGDPTSFKYLNPRLPKPLFGRESLCRDTAMIWVVEGVFDMWPLIEAKQSAVAVGGVGISRQVAEELRLFASDRPILVAFDNDAGDSGAGQLNARKRVRQLGELGLQAVAIRPPDPYKDIGEWSTAVGIKPILQHGFETQKGVFA